MKVIEYGIENHAVIMLIHGGGLAPWHYKKEAELLKEQFHVVMPILDGHSGSDSHFISIEDQAGKLIRYIDEAFGGQVLFIGGLSLGGQILLEMLSQRKNICQFALAESVLALPMKATAVLIKPAFSLCYPLIEKRWFAKLQFQSLHMNSSLFEAYYKDSAAIQKDDMTAFLRANAGYQIKTALSDCQAKTLVLVGSKERGIMKKSAEMISQTIKNARLEMLQGYYHGDLSLNHPDSYTEKLLRFIGKI